jgi:hypothetical protein
MRKGRQAGISGGLLRAQIPFYLLLPDFGVIFEHILISLFKKGKEENI